MEPLTLSKIFEYLKTNHLKLTKKEETAVKSIFEQIDLQDDNGNYVTDENGKNGDGKLNITELTCFRNIIFGVTKLENKFGTFLAEILSDYHTDLLNKQNTENEKFDYFALNKTFNPSKFDEDTLRKNFPEELYDIEVKCNNITVKDKNNPNKNNVVLAVKIGDKGSKYVGWNKDSKKVKQIYDAANNLVRTDISNDKENVTTNYVSGYKKDETDNKTGIISYFDNRGILNKRQGKLKIAEGDTDEYTAHYKDGRITDIVNLRTGIKTIFKENGEETCYDGTVLSQRFLKNDPEINEEFINKLSLSEKTDFCNNINLFTGYTYEQLEFVFNTQMTIIKELGGYTKDIEQYISMYLNEVKSSDNPQADNNLTERISAFLDHINQRIIILQSDKKRPLKEPNGKIDEDFSQGYTGDCWLLSSIKAIASTKAGKKKLNGMISVQKENGGLVSVTVKLQGKDYLISSEELHSAVEYATGDLDVRALEIAVNRFCVENGYKDITAGSTTKCGFSILLEDASALKENREVEESSDIFSASFDYVWAHQVDFDFVQKLKAGNYTAVVGGAYKNMFAFDTQTGEAVKILEGHAYTVLKVDRKYVYLINPHDSSKTLQLEHEQLKKTFVQGDLFKI